MNHFDDQQGAALEQRLKAALPPPPPGLGAIVASAVAGELIRQRRRSQWAFVAGLAAAMLIGLNLSLSAGASPLRPAPALEGQAIAQLAAAARQAAPELSEAEARRQAILLCASENLLPWQMPRGGMGTEALARTERR